MGMFLTEEDQHNQMKREKGKQPTELTNCSLSLVYLIKKNSTQNINKSVDVSRPHSVIDPPKFTYHFLNSLIT